MAHCEKYTKMASVNILKHNARETTKDGEYIKRKNEMIDPERTGLNYNLGPDHGEFSPQQFMKKRTDEIHKMNRKDVVYMCDWVVTKPKDVKPEDERKFFEATYRFLENEYGEKNVIGGFVHKDETTPHIHFSWVPAVPDNKHGGEKLGSHEQINRNYLKQFHPRLSKYIEQELGYAVEVQNEATIEGNKTVVELKRQSCIDEIKKIEEIEKSNAKAKEKAEAIQRDYALLNEIKNDLPKRSKFIEPDDVKVKKQFLTGIRTVEMSYESYEYLVSWGKYAMALKAKEETTERVIDKIAKMNSYDALIKEREENKKLKENIEELLKEKHKLLLDKKQMQVDYDAKIERKDNFIKQVFALHPDIQQQIEHQQRELQKARDQQRREAERSRGYGISL